MISFTKAEDHHEIIYQIHAPNGVDLGQLYQEVDGYWVYLPELRGGFWDAQHMRAIADKLDELNAPWDKQIKEELSKLENRDATHSG